MAEEINGGDIKIKVQEFYNALLNDKHHRYKSWEHCYQYFREPNIEIDKACLHLSFYLASWGMYRGSCFLLWKDYLIHEPLVNEIAHKIAEFQNIDFLNASDEQLNKIIRLSDWIIEHYEKNAGSVNGEKKNTRPTITLVTKILMGTLGCAPAFDTFFWKGLGIKENLPRKLKREYLDYLVKFYQEHESAFNELSEEIRVGDKPYPVMKLIDMYFWQKGVQKKSSKPQN